MHCHRCRDENVKKNGHDREGQPLSLRQARVVLVKHRLFAQNSPHVAGEGEHLLNPKKNKGQRMTLVLCLVNSLSSRGRPDKDFSAC